MQFHLINDDKLQIIVSREDMARRDIRKWGFSPHNPESQRMFEEILEEAYEACGFEVGQNAQLMIEAYPMTGESMLITVTKLKNGSLGLPFDLDFEGLGQALREELQQLAGEELPEAVTNECVYRFVQLEDVIQAVKALHLNYDGKTQLFRYQDAYYFVLYSADALTDADAAILSEYGDTVRTASAFFQEHGQVIIPENALAILADL